jgi:ribosomal protein S27E
VPLCKENQIEVLCDTTDCDEPFLTVTCGGCGKRLLRSEEGWYVIDYGVIKQAVRDHLLEVRVEHLDIKWQVFRDKLK